MLQAPDPITPEFIKKDKECKVIIIGCLSDGFLECEKDKDTGFEMWRGFENEFEIKSITSHLYLRRKLLSLKFQEDGSL